MRFFSWPSIDGRVDIQAVKLCHHVRIAFNESRKKRLIIRPRPFIIAPRRRRRRRWVF